MRSLTALLTLILISTLSLQGQIIDSNITLCEAIEGTTAPDSIIQQLVIVDVEYYSTDSLLHRGQIVVNRTVEQEVRQIFEYIKRIKYPVESVIPIKFDLPNGNTSMAELNNTYSFHYRTKAGDSKNLSRHSLGLAIDVNPFDNPYISKKWQGNPPRQQLRHLKERDPNQRLRPGKRVYITRLEMGRQLDKHERLYALREVVLILGESSLK